MKYVAVKYVHFDRDYAVGEIIPDGVVDESRAETLIKMGRIIKAVEPEPTVEPKSTEEPEKPKQAVKKGGK